ncbi:MAG: RES domain-containing protein [Bacteroidia bacterium]|nr:RES domain-containing protein [Bacteroidia bacterium]
MIESIFRDPKKRIINDKSSVLEGLAYFRNLSSRGLHNLTVSEIQSLKEKYLKFFNLNLAVWSDTYPTKLFRISNNKNINGGLRKKIYKPSDLVAPQTKWTKLNRCNLPGERVFYAALDLDTALWETQPKPGDYITISEWKIKEGQHLNTHYIFDLDNINISKETRESYHHYLSLKAMVYPNVVDIFEELLKFFSHECRKPVSQGQEINYLFSALMSSELLQHNPDKKEFRVEAICYPSIKKKYSVTNLAVINSIVFERLDLVKVTVLEIGETDFDSSKEENNLMKVHPIQVTSTNFDILNDKIIYDEEDEIRQQRELHYKWLIEENKKWD